MVPYWFPQDEIPELKDYTDFHKLSEGGFGDVYEAIQKSESGPHPVIVKRSKPAFQDEKYRERLVHEMKVLKSLDHPGIPRYIDGYAGEKEVFYIMERVPGMALVKLAQHARTMKEDFPQDFAFQGIHQVAEILRYLHHWKNSRGEEDPLIHGDIKPGNLIVTEAGKIHLIDFSMATFIKSEAKFKGGTRKYLPLEYFVGEPPSPGADLYALALTLFCLLTGEHPLEKAKSEYAVFQQLMTEQPWDKITKARFPKPLEDFLKTGMAKEEKDRFQEAGEFDEALLQVSRELKLNLEDWEKFKSEIRHLTILGS
jgi:serine/threonine-protein kinase